MGTPTKRRPGRPRAAVTDKRSGVIKVAVSMRDRLALEEKAAGQPLSRFLRERGLA